MQPNPRPDHRFELNSGIDASAMNAALELLKANGIKGRQTSAYQIKAGSYSYYPGKGTIYRDGDASKLNVRGIKAFIELVKREADEADESVQN